MYLNVREYANFWGEKKNFCITNSLTNDIFIVDKTYCDFIVKHHNKKIDEVDIENNKILMDLIENDIIFLTEKQLDVESHLKIAEKFYNIFADDKKKFFELNVEITTKCDNLCENCLENDPNFNCLKDCFKGDNIINVQKAKIVINDFINRGGKSIKFTGGNIFLAEEELDQLCKFIREKSKVIPIILNLVSIEKYEDKFNYFISKYSCLLELSIFDSIGNTLKYSTFFKNFIHVRSIILVKFFLSNGVSLPCEILEEINSNNIMVQVHKFFNSSDEYFKIYHSLGNCKTINPEHLNSIDYLGKNRCFNGKYYYSADNIFIPCAKIRNEKLGETLLDVFKSKKYEDLLGYIPKNISKCNGCGLVEFCKPCYFFKEFLEHEGNCFEQQG